MVGLFPAITGGAELSDDVVFSETLDGLEGWVVDFIGAFEDAFALGEGSELGDAFALGGGCGLETASEPAGARVVTIADRAEPCSCRAQNPDS